MPGQTDIRSRRLPAEFVTLHSTSSFSQQRKSRSRNAGSCHRGFWFVGAWIVRFPSEGDTAATLKQADIGREDLGRRRLFRAYPSSVTIAELWREPPCRRETI